MKSITLIFSLLFVQIVQAQPKIKVYAFSQVFVRGMATSREINNPSQSTVYYIYVSSSKNTTIQPKKIFIKDSWYSIASYKPAKTELVAAGKNKLMQIETGGVLKKGTSSSELLLSYTWKGHSYIAAVKKIKQLETVRAQ